MEVHHHAHHYEIKNWKIYLWEFIMLFLAVFSGFLAENQREYMVERKREKQYIRTLIKDIQTDLSNSGNRVAEYSETINRIDTILSNFDAFTKDFSSAGGRNFLYILYNHDDFIYTDRTMQQLKYAGGLRLIKPSASDSIIAYDSDVKSLFNQVDYNTEIYVQLIDLANKMISYRNAVKDNHTKFLYQLAAPKADIWIKHDPALFQQLYNQLYIYSITNNYSVIRLKRLQKRGNGLINFLKNEYHLE
ncbi:MAG TPA: hypothetical protein VIL78_17880 [Hanamia sp.]